MTWFAIFACIVFGLYFWRQYRARQIELASPLADHRLGVRHIGQTMTLDSPIRNGAGRIKIGNREWNIRGPELPVGARVRVTGVDGSVLLVDRVTS